MGEKPPPKRCKRKWDAGPLPTPPPDPRTDDFLAYLETLQATPASFAPALAAEDAFDHLEKLYKLMEQMLELRDQNAKLQRKIRDLERLNNLEKLHRGLDLELDYPDLDKDTRFAETILESILSEAKPAKKHRLRRSISRKHQRSGSITLTAERPPEGPRRASIGLEDFPKKTKVSKWTKVKAAFRWEKASTTIEASGLGGPSEKYLRVPSEDLSGTTPDTISTASSTEDFPPGPCDEFKSSDDEHHYILHSKEGSQKSNKSHRTPWARMKDIIQTRNSFKKKHRLSGHSDDIQIDVELCSDNEDNVFDEDPGLPSDVVERYQKALAEDSLSLDSKRASKWSRVKKAFLPSSAPITPTPRDDIQDEIQRSYKRLQEKLSQEFQEKLSEWEKIKQNSPGTSNPSSVSAHGDDTKDTAFMKKMEEWEKIKSQPRPQNLPPEFRKKLQEWEKIRKLSNKETNTKKKLAEVPRWKSLSGPKSESPVLSEDFRKKLEEWKQIKAGDKPKKTPEWFEKEKRLLPEQGLEKEDSGVKVNKKEILIHTRSGCYRFEGISRKFTRKLYEWEKAKGIGPESSTFALLAQTKDLVRSKSADSISTGPNLGTKQLSSFSLNNLEELESEAEEPEALIVEVEDIIEETAGPLCTLTEKQQLPVYQTQELKSICEGGTCLAPKIRKSESRRAQNNYNLIEEILSILRNLTENEAEIQKTQELLSEEAQKSSAEIIRLKMFDEAQKAMAGRLTEKILKLQDANASILTTNDDNSDVLEVLESIQEVTGEVLGLTERLEDEVNGRNVYDIYREVGAQSLNPVPEMAKEMRTKMLELRRRLSYICAASDLTAPRRRSKERLYQKSDYSTSASQGAVKKKIRCRQKVHRTIVDSEEEEDEEAERRNLHRKLTRTRSVPETGTETNALDSPVTVFVKTTRKLFTPLVTSSFGDEQKLPVKHLPPAPRKSPNISPSIRIMVAKYNQKISEAPCKSGGSSGSASPVAWRSPIAERRVKAQTEKYQEELTRQQEKLLVVKYPSSPEMEKRTDVRLQKLQKAREEFFKEEAPERIKRFSQISADDSESSYEVTGLMKSASAGMINIEVDAYRQIDPEVHGGGYVSLPRNAKLQKNVLGQKFGLSQLASKFRKVKMRKGKEGKEGKKKMNTVQTLCRQSLLVNISQEAKPDDETPPPSRSSSWIRKAGFFKKGP